MPQMSPISYGLVPPSGAQVSKAVYNFILSLSVQDYTVFNCKYTTLHLQWLMKLWNFTSKCPSKIQHTEQHGYLYTTQSNARRDGPFSL